MQPDTVNTRLKLPTTVYKELKHLAVDRGVAVSDLLVAAAEQLVKDARADGPHEALQG